MGLWILEFGLEIVSKIMDVASHAHFKGHEREREKRPSIEEIVRIDRSDI